MTHCNVAKKATNRDRPIRAYLNEANAQKVAQVRAMLKKQGLRGTTSEAVNFLLAKSKP